MSLPRFSVKNTVLVNMLMIVVLVGGGLTAFTLVREMFPESRPGKIIITAVYPGVQPADIEKSVTIKIEEALRDVDGIDKIDSVISNGVSNTAVTLKNDVEDTDVLRQEIETKIDGIADMPDGVERITITKVVPRLPVIAVAIYGDKSEEELKDAATKLRDQLLQLPGVSDVDISGTRADEIAIEVKPGELLRYNITFEQVSAAIRNTNVDISGGVIKGTRRTINVRILGEESRAIELEDLVITDDPVRGKVRLRDVANVVDGFVESDLEGYFNSMPAVYCTVFKTGSQDAIQISSTIKAFVKGKQAGRGEEVDFDPYGIQTAFDAEWWKKPLLLIGAQVSKAASKIASRADPEKIFEESRNNPFSHDFEVALISDLARFVEGRLDLLTRNGLFGLVLVLISLYLFLNRKVAFWAAIGLPVSFFGTFLAMQAMGLTLNLLSMFGLIIVLGIIVDDAIVIGENIYRHVEEGEHPRIAAVKGAEEVMWPVTVAVMTTIAAFSPLLFVSGQMGDFTKMLPMVVIAALSVSLLEALIILPAHLANLPTFEEQERKRLEKQRAGSWRQKLGAKFGGMQDWFMKSILIANYERFLRVAVKWRYVTIATSVAALIVSLGLFVGGIVKWEFIQKMDSETLIGALEMPVGTTADRTKDEMQKLSEYARRMPEVSNVQMFVSRQYDLSGAATIGVTDSSHLGQIVLELKTADEREQLGLRSSEELLFELRKFGDAQLSGVNSMTWESLAGGPGGKDISIQIHGPKLEDVRAVARELKKKLASYDGVFDLDDDMDRGQREVQLTLRKSAEPTGITVSGLGGHVRGALYGNEARRINRNREDVKITVRYPREFRENVWNLESMWIPTSPLSPDRGWVPLKHVASIKETEGDVAIHRGSRNRSVTVQAEVDKEQTSPMAILARIRADFDQEIKPKYPEIKIEFLGASEEQAKSFSSLKIATPVALLLVYMLLAGLFRSYVQPLVVMAAIPFGIMGAIIGHWITGYPLTILSVFGFVALIGILVNDSLVLVDFINKRIRDGMEPFEASIEGAKLRLRAILLTTLTTVAGLTPLMFETSFQAKFLIPMAVTLTFGLIFATALTLVIVPAINMILFDISGVAKHHAEEADKVDVDDV